MKPIFLSYYINENTPSYGGERNVFRIEKLTSIDNGDRTNNTKLHFNSHLGTHIDFPLHFFKEGKSIDDYDASYWVFKNIAILECQTNEIENHLDEIDNNVEILILKTNFHKFRGKETYWRDQPIISSTLPLILKKRFPYLRVFGFDLISLTSKLNREEGRLAHLNFLSEPEILIIEDMDLRQLNVRPTKIIISPLMISGVEGVPCTIIAY